jgi:hypothetical protein
MVGHEHSLQIRKVTHDIGEEQLEDYVLSNAGAHELRVCVFTGPIMRLVS